MNFHGLADGFADSNPWIQRAIGILENDLDIFSYFSELAFRNVSNVFAIEINDAGRRLNKPQDGSAQCCFPAATFAYQPYCLTFFYFKTDTIHCFKHLENFTKKIFL